jgi:cytochrome P450
LPHSHIDLAEYLADPIATLKKAREESWVSDLQFSTSVMTHEDVRALLAEPRLRANFPEFLRTFGVTSGPFYEWMASSPLNRDGADHVAWRSLMSRTFTPRRVEGIRPFLRTAAHALIDGFAARGRCEFVGEFADAYPSLGLCELIGVPQEDRDRFRGWANTIGLGFSPIDLAPRIADVDTALVQLLDYASRLARRRRAEPRDDLVTRIAQAAAEDGWPEDRVSGSIAGLVFAGHETTKNQLGWMVAVLAGKERIWNGVADGSLAAANVVEEVLRFRSAVAGTGRTVAEDVEHKGERLEAGTHLFLSIWSADHDDKAYAHPDTIDPARNGDAAPHLAFGHGAHFCLGAALARAELQEGLTALASRLSCPTLEEGASWKPPVGINGPLALPITFAARGA